MRLFCFIILLLYVGTTQPSIYTNLKQSVQKLLRRGFYNNDLKNNIEPKELSKFLMEKDNKESDAKRAKSKAKIVQKARRLKDNLKYGQDFEPMRPSNKEIGNRYYRIDPVLNQIESKRRHQLFQIDARRKDDSSFSDSSSLEMKDWKEEFNEYWLKKKFEAVNSTDPRGDVVNMVAARPWGVPCGDPNQHDMPWGNCMLSTECDSEYRIYRGDSFCGRTQFVCCALQLTNYDLYQGFDISFAASSFETDSTEKRDRDRGSKENKKRKKEKQKNKRLKDRKRRKRQMKKNIRRIVHEIRKILNRSFRNASQHRKKRTMLLKKYIRDLKKQYKKDRKSVRDIHTNDMEKIDAALERKLEQIRDMNRNFLTNSTFRDIVVNGTITRQGARMLAQAYPELKKYLRGKLRRDGGGPADTTNEKNDYLEYDIEYGALYY